MATEIEYTIFETECFELENSHGCIIKKNNRDESFIKELNELQFEDEITAEAFNIYKSMKLNIKRKDNRLGLKFFCIYNAYRNFNITKDPIKIAEKVGLHSYNLTKIFKTFSYENTGYKMKKVEINPLGYIKDYYENTGFRMDEIDNIYKFAESIVNKNKLEGEYPQKVAIGIIIYYITKIHNERISDKFFDYLGKTENNFQEIVNTIGKIYNN